jgi:hypothetical protein
MSLAVDELSVDEKSVDELSVDGLSPHPNFAPGFLPGASLACQEPPWWLLTGN